jgi:hypothetical protein
MVQRNPTCCVYLTVQVCYSGTLKTGGLGLNGAVAPPKKKSKIIIQNRFSNILCVLLVSNFN